jgi:protein phosphatase-4 regulatory subunit 3
MASDLQPPNDRKRVKVYELRDNDWFDRGTGFCMGQILDDEPRIYVQSEDEPDRVLLETRITKDDGYQKQQGQPPSQSSSYRTMNEELRG